MGTGSLPRMHPHDVDLALTDGSSVRLPAGATGEELAAALGVDDAVAVRSGGTLVDLQVPLPETGPVELVRAGEPDGRSVLRHSTAHVLAQAVLDLWPGASFAIGPPIEDGFYYDFLLPGGAHFREEDLSRIEARMREIVGEAQPFERAELSIEEGLELFEAQPFKREIIEGVAAGPGASDAALEAEGVEGQRVSVYRNGPGFVDLCRGPHVPSTARLGSFRLLRTAGAYWRGDERRDQLQRIYGTAWESEEALAAHLERLAEAERRDHRRIGRELDLFSFPPELGPGLPVYHPKGARIRYEMEEFARRHHLEAGYELVATPHAARSSLFETSGHLGWYAESMFPGMEVEGVSYHLKPMNCPMHVLVYRSRARSYRELPLRLFELGTVYRFERSGVLHGLTRVRGFTQDDAHIFCAPGQLGAELAALLGFVLAMLGAFGLGEFEAELATRPEKSVGDPADWAAAEAALRHALDVTGLPYRIAAGEGAFYAPKIDLHLRDAIGRRWQVSTLQVDLQLPQLFDLDFTGEDNGRHRPYMIHRALFGSVDRFLAILLEHYEGALPCWLSPVQAAVLPVGAAHEAYATDVAATLAARGVRAEVRAASESLGARIRDAKLAKIPWILVVGAEDVAGGSVGVNARGGARPERGVALSEAADRIAADATPPPLLPPEPAPGPAGRAPRTGVPAPRAGDGAG